MRRMRHALPWLLGAVAVAVAVAAALGAPVAVRAAAGFVSFGRDMATVLPAAFVAIGLFEVWVPRAAVERHLGRRDRRWAQWFWMVLLAGTSVGGLYVALPVAASLCGKGARLGLVLTYLGLAGVCRVPMALFEASFLGPAFTVVRFAVSLPLVILVSELLGAWLERRGYAMPGAPPLAADR